jgi:hypothetical protein
MWRRDARSAADELAAECEAFLAGRYPEYLRYRGHAIPAWAWTNPLAHAPEEQLRTMISTRGGTIGPAGVWAHACCYVAGELLDLAERRGPLTELQATALVPLELELISRRDVVCWRPGTWVATVMAVLSDHRRTRRGTAR